MCKISLLSLVSVSLLALLFSPLAVAHPTFGAAQCRFELGFKVLHDLIPDIVGECLEDVHYNPSNGDGLQETINGLLVWRKYDNFTAFTDGNHTWINGPYGLQKRLNTERFTWERKTLNVRAYIDGVSDLLFKGNTVFWHNLNYAAPGRWSGHDEPTYLNGVAWQPVWPDKPDKENRDCNCDSSSYTVVAPLAAQEQTVGLEVVEARGIVDIIEQPDKTHDYTLIVLFDDSAPNGAAWYEINLTYYP